MNICWFLISKIVDIVIISPFVVGLHALFRRMNGPQELFEREKVVHVRDVLCICSAAKFSNFKPVLTFIGRNSSLIRAVLESV